MKEDIIVLSKQDGMCYVYVYDCDSGYYFKNLNTNIIVKGKVKVSDGMISISGKRLKFVKLSDNEFKLRHGISEKFDDYVDKLFEPEKIKEKEHKFLWFKWKVRDDGWFRLKETDSFNFKSNCFSITDNREMSND